MWMLVSYMDESGHAEDPNFHFSGMAGFVAPALLWEDFSGKWQTVLDRFDLKEAFHMKDFAHFQGQFEHGWKGKENKARREDLFGSLVKEILDLNPVPIGAMVSVEDFNSLSECQRNSFHTPYHLAFQTCTRGAALEGISHNERVAMVYAYNQEFGAILPKEIYSVDQAGNAEKLWHAIRTMTDFGKGMGGYSSDTPQNMIPLQAADLFAYELAKEFENLLVRPNDNMRWGLQQLLSLVDFPTALIRLFDRKELLRTVKEGQFPCRTGIEEVDEHQLWEARRKLSEHFQHRTKRTSPWRTNVK